MQMRKEQIEELKVKNENMRCEIAIEVDRSKEAKSKADESNSKTIAEIQLNKISIRQKEEQLEQLRTQKEQKVKKMKKEQYEEKQNLRIELDSALQTIRTEAKRKRDEMQGELNELQKQIDNQRMDMIEEKSHLDQEI